MILILGLALAAPNVVVSFDNGGFNLPLYTSRWNGAYEQPSVAEQVTTDIARTLGRSPRVFLYLPPGPEEGRSSDPYEVLPGTTGEVGPCAPGDRCWDKIGVNTHPAASTSLHQAAMAIRDRVGTGPRLEIHFTDLFEEDPSTSSRPADADRCVTEGSTRKALEALMRGPDLHHVAVGRLAVEIPPPRIARGGATRFVEAGGGCWTAERVRTFGGGGGPFSMAMGVVVLGFGTDGMDAEIRALIADLGRQVSRPLSLDLVTVREPSAHVAVIPSRLSSPHAAALPSLPPRTTPCTVLTGRAFLQAGGQTVPAVVDANCDGVGSLTFPAAGLQAAFLDTAGLSPFVSTLDVSGTLLLQGDTHTMSSAVQRLPLLNPASDRPLPFWPALVQSLRFDEVGGVARPRSARIDVEGVQIVDVDSRPWTLAGISAAFAGLLTTLLLYGILARAAAARAFRRHLQQAGDAPLGAMLQEASAAGREGWGTRLVVALGFGVLVAGFGGLMVLMVAGVLGA